MTPHLLLSLWRERWGKTAEAGFRRPYLLGKPNTLGQRLVNAGVWKSPGVSFCILAVGGALLLWMTSIRFSLGGQVAFTLCIAGFVLYLQRYKGTLIALTLFALLTLVSVRYFLWRFSSTLGPGFSVDFLLGFGLCVAELHLWLLGITQYIRTLWPLKQRTKPLPDSQGKWPTVDVYLATHEQDVDTVRQSFNAVRAMEWPKSKLRVFLLDGSLRPAIQELSNVFRVSYIVDNNVVAPLGETISAALHLSKGEIVVIFDADATPERDFLKLTLGWFIQNPALGCLQSTQRPTQPASTTCTILRRSILLESDGFETGRTQPYAALARRLREQGYCSAEYGVDAELPLATGIYRTDLSQYGKIPAWKERLALTHAMLQFYQPVAFLIILTAPIAYLLAGVHLFQSQAEWLAAYAIPHFLSYHVVKVRQRDPGRLPIWTDVRHTALEWYLPFVTLLSVLRIELRVMKSRIKALLTLLATRGRTTFADTALNETHRTWRVHLIAFLGLNVAGFGGGLSQLGWSGLVSSPEPAFYLGWCLFNVSMLVSAVAITNEKQNIQQHVRSLACLPAMIRAPSGHTLRCTTENFPSQNLTLSLPVELDLKADSEITLSIFYENREFSFSATVDCLKQSRLHTCVDIAANAAYQHAAAVIFSRGSDWPNWLPGSDADNPLPQWFTSRLMSGINSTLALIVRIGNTLQIARLLRWIHKRTQAL